MIGRYPATSVAIIGMLVFGAVILVLLAPGLNADPAQVAILIGVLIVGIQQVVSQRTSEANGHRLAAVEKVADAVTLRVDDAGIPQPPVIPVVIVKPENGM